MIQQYQFVQHIKTALGTMLRGVAACQKLVESQNEEDDDCEGMEPPLEFVIMPE